MLITLPGYVQITAMFQLDFTKINQQKDVCIIVHLSQPYGPIQTQWHVNKDAQLIILLMILKENV